MMQPMGYGPRAPMPPTSGLPATPHNNMMPRQPFSPFSPQPPQQPVRPFAQIGQPGMKNPMQIQTL